MNKPRRIYLDNAATSWPKPESVYSAVESYMRENGAPSGRGVYREAIEVSRLVADARLRIADLINAGEPRRIIFTLNGTDSLNLAIHGLLRPGNHVITSVVEHNSVLRPLRHLEDRGEISVTRVPCGSEGIIDPDAVRAALRPSTRLITLIHASNVTGALQPVFEVGRIAHEADVFFLVDAAQSLGHLPIDVQAMQCDLLAAPGHKGLLGPLGTGVLYVGPRAELALESCRQGGTGSKSDEDRQPLILPDRYEAGNLNIPGIVGVGAGVTWLQSHDVSTMQHQSSELTIQLINGLSSIEGVQVLGPKDSHQRVGLVSMTLNGWAPQEVSMLLESEHSIQTRPGLHCAPLMHRALGTADQGGALRLSIGPFNTSNDVTAALTAISEVSAMRLEF
jgi:cysteine desulfurase family protein